MNNTGVKTSFREKKYIIKILRRFFFSFHLVDKIRMGSVNEMFLIKKVRITKKKRIYKLGNWCQKIFFCDD